MSVCNLEPDEAYYKMALASWNTLLALLTDDEDSRAICLKPCSGDGALLLERKMVAIDVMVTALTLRPDTESDTLDALGFCSC